MGTEKIMFVIFRILWDALPLRLLRMPVAWFSLFATWFICFDHSNSDHLRGHQGILLY